MKRNSLLVISLGLAGCVEQGPAPRDDAVVTREDQAIIIDVRKNDRRTRRVGPRLPSHGKLRELLDGTMEYTPEADFTGQDSFEYVAYGEVDGDHRSATATVTIDVEPDRSARVQDLSLPTAVMGLASADFDGDGSPDLATLLDDGVLSVLLQRPEAVGPASFETTTVSSFDTYPLVWQLRPRPLISDDLDGDGRADLVVAAWNELRILYNRSSETGLRFEESSLRFDTADNIASVGQIVSGDFDCDGSADLAVFFSDVFPKPETEGGERLRILPAGSYVPGVAAYDPAASTNLFGYSSDRLVVGDVLESDCQSLYALSNRGLRRYTFGADGLQPGTLVSERIERANDMLVDDLNGDGESELFVANRLGSLLALATESDREAGELAVDATGLSTGNFMADGTRELVAADRCMLRFFALSAGSLQLSATGDLEPDEGSYFACPAIATGLMLSVDLDGDGRDEVVAAHHKAYSDAEGFIARQDGLFVVSSQERPGR